MSGGRDTNNIDKHNRFDVFKQKVMHVQLVNVQLVNQQDKPYKLKLNKFADMTNHELRSSCAGADDDHHRMFHGAQRGSTSIMYEDDTLVPPSIDWREKGAVTDVMHQRQARRPDLPLPRATTATVVPPARRRPPLSIVRRSSEFETRDSNLPVLTRDHLVHGARHPHRNRADGAPSRLPLDCLGFSWVCPSGLLFWVDKAIDFFEDLVSGSGFLLGFALHALFFKLPPESELPRPLTSARVMASVPKATEPMATATFDEAIPQRSTQNLVGSLGVTSRPNPSVDSGHVIAQRTNAVAGSSRAASARRQSHSRG
ncbi:hypothetical protein NL676_025016 [Syzygium grande]|nr:hypothetical protein NL676_025016 [Syzygium grande]